MSQNLFRFIWFEIMCNVSKYIACSSLHLCHISALMNNPLSQEIPIFSLFNIVKQEMNLANFVCVEFNLASGSPYSVSLIVYGTRVTLNFTTYELFKKLSTMVQTIPSGVQEIPWLFETPKPITDSQESDTRPHPGPLQSSRNLHNITRDFRYSRLWRFQILLGCEAVQC